MWCCSAFMFEEAPALAPYGREGAGFYGKGSMQGRGRRPCRRISDTAAGAQPPTAEC